MNQNSSGVLKAASFSNRLCSRNGSACWTKTPPKVLGLADIKRCRSQWHPKHAMSSRDGVYPRMRRDTLAEDFVQLNHVPIRACHVSTNPQASASVCANIALASENTIVCRLASAQIRQANDFVCVFVPQKIPLANGLRAKIW